MREDIFVHEPFLKELENIGWNDKTNGCEVIRLDRLHQKPQQSYRESFSDVVMKSKLRESLLKINDFLEEDQIEECVTRLISYSSNGLITNNSKIFELLLNGMSVSENRKTKDKSILSYNRLEKIYWIKEALQDPDAILKVGWDAKNKTYDGSRRITVVKDNYIVVIIIFSPTKARFVTAYEVDAEENLEKIMNSPDYKA